MFLLAPHHRIFMGHLIYTKYSSCHGTRFARSAPTNQQITNNNNGFLLLLKGPPYFTTRPQNTTVVAGTDVMLECAANGDPPPKTRWRRIGPGFPPDGVALDLPSFKVMPGKGLHLRHVLPEQDGFYECQAISVVGSNRVVARLTVNKAPVITRRPVKEIVLPLDGDATLECNATGNPKPILLWMRERDRTVLLPGDRTDTGML
jgi:hypothetical protein